MFLAAAALGVSLLVLALAGFLWWASRQRIDSSNRNWDQRFEVSQANVAQVRNLAAEGQSRSVAAETTAVRSMTAAEAAARAAEKSAASAEQSAKAAGEAATALKAMAESGRRAWVHPVDFRFTLRTQQVENSSLDVSIANLGSTPARELKVSTNFLISEETPEDLSLKPRVFNLALGPGINFSLSHFLRISQADMVSITAGRKLLLACGKAQYRDVFDIARETQWCAVYDANAKAFVASDRHNLTT